MPDPQFQLLIPAADVDAPEFSFVIPARNERAAIAACVEWCLEGARRAGVAAEVLIVDSSTDDTPEIALDRGARVLKTPPRGLGQAYIDAIPYIRGACILMGDADGTYDFRDIGGFVERFRGGCEFIMGSRFRGWVAPGSMPPLHRYFGIPLTTWMLNVLYRTRFSDIHCGMRGITREALERMRLESQSWEYASEMVLKAVCLGLRTAEVPVSFLRAPEGRISHMKRRGWLEPWRAGWVNLRALLVYGADFFTLRPGLGMLAVGLFLMLGSALGPVRIGPLTLSLYWSLAGLALGIVGLESFCLGCIVQVIYSYTAESRARWLRLFAYTRSMAAAGALALGGAALTAPLVRRYVAGGYRLSGTFEWQSRMAVVGLFLLVAAFTLVNATLAVHAAALSARGRYEP
ncbi:MAG TPA: glycosyltransferase family 2 protein [Bryobacteraceae bacterium]|nr:glycosyltransferase family 2 protein [Bryobacteraceae bacterium]